jgi:hypothetical protein
MGTVPAAPSLSVRRGSGPEAELVTQEAHDVLELVEQLGKAFHGGLQRSAERRG